MIPVVDNVDDLTVSEKVSVRRFCDISREYEAIVGCVVSGVNKVASRALSCKIATTTLLLMSVINPVPLRYERILEVATTVIAFNLFPSAADSCKITTVAGEEDVRDDVDPDTNANLYSPTSLEFPLDWMVKSETTNEVALTVSENVREICNEFMFRLNEANTGLVVSAMKDDA